MTNIKRTVLSETKEIGLESDNTSNVNVRESLGAARRNVNSALSRRELSNALIARFHEKYRVAHGCWLWTAGKYPRGYGMVNLGRFADGRQQTTYAHRVAYVLMHGNIPAGLVVMHTCDVPACVNPAHLRLGSQGDNIRDASSKGRLPKTRNRRAA